LPALALDAEGGDGPGHETLDFDGLPAILAGAERAVFDALEGGVDLLEKLLLALPKPYLESLIDLLGSYVTGIEKVFALAAKVGITGIESLAKKFVPAPVKLFPDFVEFSFSHIQSLS
jgi:hypothetical protein